MTTTEQRVNVTTIHSDCINGYRIGIEQYAEGNKPAHKLKAYIIRELGMKCGRYFKLDGTNRNFCDQYVAAKSWAHEKASE